MGDGESAVSDCEPSTPKSDEDGGDQGQLPRGHLTVAAPATILRCMTTNGWQVAAGLLAATAVSGGCSGEAAGKRPATVTVTVPVTASPATVTALPSPAATFDAVQPTTRPVPANPVPILAKIKGCVIPADTKVGLTDIQGDRYAGCDLSGVAIEVRTFPGDPKVVSPDWLRSDDGRRVIVGRDFTVVASAAPSSLAKIHLEEIAAEVGGTVLTAS